MFKDRGHMGAFAIVHDMRTCWMLQPVEEQTRGQTLSQDKSSDNEII
jgi:hypothetical protein